MMPSLSPPSITFQIIPCNTVQQARDSPSYHLVLQHNMSTSPTRSSGGKPREFGFLSPEFRKALANWSNGSSEYTPSEPDESTPALAKPDEPRSGPIWTVEDDMMIIPAAHNYGNFSVPRSQHRNTVNPQFDGSENPVYSAGFSIRLDDKEAPVITPWYRPSKDTQKQNRVNLDNFEISVVPEGPDHVSLFACQKDVRWDGAGEDSIGWTGSVLQSIRIPKDYIQRLRDAASRKSGSYRAPAAPSATPDC
jgi:hypothetical protein